MAGGSRLAASPRPARARPDRPGRASASGVSSASGSAPPSATKSSEGTGFSASPASPALSACSAGSWAWALVAVHSKMVWSGATPVPRITPSGPRMPETRYEPVLVSVSSMMKEMRSVLMVTLRALPVLSPSFRSMPAPSTVKLIRKSAPTVAISHAPSKRVSLRSLILWCRPSIQTERIWALSSPLASEAWKSGAVDTIRLACLPASMVPRVSETPSSSAGLVVSMAWACCGVRPASMAWCRLVQKFWLRGSFEEVIETCRPFSASQRGLAGPCSHAASSSRLTESAAPTLQTSGVLGWMSGAMMGRPASASASRRRNSVPEPTMATRSCPNSAATLSPSRASSSKLVS